MIIFGSDFGIEDEYVPICKGVIKSANLNTHILDYTHNYSNSNLLWVSYSLYYDYKFFPKGSVFLIVVDPGVGTDRNILIVKYKSYYFVGPDNGIFSHFINDDESEVYKLDIDKFKNVFGIASTTFHGRDIFSKIAAQIDSNNLPYDMFELYYESIILDDLSCDKTEEKIRGKVINIDKFGNIITNITLEDLEHFERREYIVKNDLIVNKLFTAYSNIEKDELGAILGSRNYLEFSINMKSACEIFDIKLGDEIIVKKI